MKAPDRGARTASVSDLTAVFVRVNFRQSDAGKAGGESWELGVDRLYPVGTPGDRRVERRDGLTILCIADIRERAGVLRECARQGHRVLLLTADTLRDADWPRDAIAEVFYISRTIGRDDLVKGVSHVARTQQIDRIVPLDDFDVETAAYLREHLRIPEWARRRRGISGTSWRCG